MGQPFESVERKPLLHISQGGGYVASIFNEARSPLQAGGSSHSIPQYMRIAVTGTPGVGKHTIASILANKLSVKIIDINDLAFKHNAIKGKDYAYIVDIDKMKSIIKDELNDNCVVVGHLAPYILDSRDIDYVIVLRRSPYELEKVYTERGYSSKKRKDNLSSEILGVIAYDSRKFDKVVEIDCTNKSPEEISEEILLYIKSGKSRFGIVDWLELVKGDIDKFFNL